ncbi:hypothetical protein HPB50_000480 [Hyalomma asiaticum]|uniref:Uncharacterized protein n=1 Tax=Hyalomma asiaticum TaxID=266040 RepID=A0ACB7SR44_HYAAI|nr:hypothetical protein HPB50_000480 [Hyalomma asiaticum]
MSAAAQSCARAHANCRYFHSSRHRNGPSLPKSVHCGEAASDRFVSARSSPSATAAVAARDPSIDVAFLSPNTPSAAATAVMATTCAAHSYDRTNDDDDVEAAFF